MIVFVSNDIIKICLGFDLKSELC